MKKYLIIGSLLIFLFITLNVKAGLVVNSKLIHEYQLDNDQIETGIIKLRNTSKKPIIVKLYKRDYSFNAEGINYYKKAGYNQRTNTDWISLSKLQLTILPFNTEEIKYRIKTPKDKKLQGTYWSMIMVETVSKGKEMIKETIDFKQKIRYGVQIITNFAKKKKINLKFNKPTFKKEVKDKYSFSTELLNQDIFDIVTEIKLIIIDNSSKEIVKEVKKQPNRLYPNTSIKISDQHNFNKKGKYQIVLIVGNKNRGYIGKKYLVEVD